LEEKHVTRRSAEDVQAGRDGPPGDESCEAPVAVVRQADQLGECPAWSGYDSTLYWVDARRPGVQAYRPATGEIETWLMPEITPGLAVAGPARLLVAFRATFAFLDTATGELTELSPRSSSSAPVRFNELKCDRQGRVWIGEMNDERRVPAGHLYRLDSGGLTPVLDGVVVPNSLCWSPDGTTMYFSDAQAPVIWQFDYDPGSGTPSRRRPFAELRADQGFPDGATVDADGCIWSTNYGGWSVVRYTPDGLIDREVQLPTAQITSCAFGGADLDTLYVTTAAQRLTPAELGDQPDAGALFEIPAAVHGLPEADAVVTA
jgi:sugar lactone lactonase YvrE